MHTAHASISLSTKQVQKPLKIYSFWCLVVRRGGITIFYKLKISADLSKPLISAFPLKSGINFTWSGCVNKVNHKKYKSKSHDCHVILKKKKYYKKLLGNERVS